MKWLIQRYAVALIVMLAFVLGLALSMLLRPAPACASFDLGDLLGDVVKAGGVKVIVDEFDDELDDLIDQVMQNNDAATDAATKVVTIVSPIGNKHIGAAQVVGPQDAVDKVNAVAQVETSFADKLFRIKVLIPIESESGTDIKRVPGVGVSAVIDVKI